MNKSESKYFNTAIKMDKALIKLLDKKPFDYITVKEICQEAGVNRSTFYLHYENTVELLEEAIEYTNDEFLSYFKDADESFISNMNSKSNDELLLITPSYLKPYLKYIKENKALHSSGVLKNAYMKPNEKFEKMTKHIFYPIMERLKVEENKRDYILAYYTHGVIAIVEQWLKNDCKESIDEICDIIINCVPRSKK